MHSSPRRSRVSFAGAALLLAACAETPTAPTTLTRTTGVTARLTSGIPLPRAVVVFEDTAGIPVAGVAQIVLLGGTVTRSYENIGVAVVDGLSPAALAQLNANA